MPWERLALKLDRPKPAQALSSSKWASVYLFTRTPPASQGWVGLREITRGRGAHRQRVMPVRGLTQPVISQGCSKLLLLGTPLQPVLQAPTTHPEQGLSNTCAWNECGDGAGRTGRKTKGRYRHSGAFLRSQARRE